MSTKRLVTFQASYFTYMQWVWIFWNFFDGLELFQLKVSALPQLAFVIFSSFIFVIALIFVAKIEDMHVV